MCTYFAEGISAPGVRREEKTSASQHSESNAQLVLGQLMKGFGTTESRLTKTQLSVDSSRLFGAHATLHPGSTILPRVFAILSMHSNALWRPRDNFLPKDELLLF